MGKQQKWLVVVGASSVAFLLLLTCLYAAFFTSNSIPFESWKQKFSNWGGSKKADQIIETSKPVEFLLRRLVRGEDRIKLDITGFSCHSDLHSDLCLVNKPVRIIDNNIALTVYIPSSSRSSVNRTVKPYANKDDGTAMSRVSPVQIVNNGEANNVPACSISHNVPAVIFSTGGGGFTGGNLFNEFNELVIPLFITARHFRSHLKFVITDYKPWWVSKYSEILTHLSHYEVINPAANGSVVVHCFPGAVIGLEYHGMLSINTTDIPGGYSMFDFKHFLRESYNLKIKNVSDEIKSNKKPILVLVSRKQSRVFLNENEMVAMMEEELGFEVVVVTRPNNRTSLNLNKFSELVNSCRVLVGAHGAGLTSQVFLPDGAVLVQVVPLGLDRASANYYGAPAREIGVQYLEYKIEPEESSLMQTYGRDHPVVTDPANVFGAKGYSAARAVYADAQNLTINVKRFKETIVQGFKQMNLLDGLIL